MTRPEAIPQLARLTGRAAFEASMGFEQGNEPAVLDDRQLTRLHEFVETRIEQLTEGLFEEAMANDDVLGATSAIVYLRDRLEFLGDLLTAAQQAHVAKAFELKVATWG